MQKRNLKKRIQKSVALASMAAFLMMPGSLAYGVNNITQGASGIGSLTNISGTTTNTQITSGFIKNGTGINHFGQFNIGDGGAASLLGANRYVNMVDSFANINGTLSAIQQGNGSLANVMFITPEGMAVGANGQMNVAGFRLVTPSQSDYDNLKLKAGAVGTAAENIEMKLTDIETINAGGEGYFQLGGKIYSTDDVVISTGNGIYFADGGVIDTTGSADGLGNISLFTNTDGILGQSTVHLDSAGNITMDAPTIHGAVMDESKGLVSKYEDESVYSKSSFMPFNVKLADGKVLNVKVADTVGESGSAQGYAAVANNSVNLKLGEIKGADVTISNNNGTISTTKDIDSVNNIYLNAKEGALSISNDITAKNIVRLNGKMGVDVDAALNVTDAGYISVYSEGNPNQAFNNGIYVKEANLKSGNIDIKAVQGDVEVGNITIAQRGPSEGVIGLKNNEKFSTGIVAPDTYRFDGAHIEATNGSVTQSQGTQITSAGRVDLTAGKEVTAKVKAHDLISATAKKSVSLDVLDTARLGDIKATVVSVNGENILVDGVVNATNVDINATDKVTIRPKYALDENHYTYGVVKGTEEVNITTQNGIFATEDRSVAKEHVDYNGNVFTGSSEVGPMVYSESGVINLVTNGDIGSDDVKVSVYAGEKVNAKGENVNLLFTGKEKMIDLQVGPNKTDTEKRLLIESANGNVGKIIANDSVSIEAQDSLVQVDDGVAIVAGGMMDLSSQKGDIGSPEQYMTVEVWDSLSTNTPNGSTYIASDESLSVINAVAGQDVLFVTPETINVSKIDAGNDVVLVTDKNVIASTVKAGNDIGISAANVEVNNVLEAGNDLLVETEGYIHQTYADKVSFKSGNDMTLISEKDNVGDPAQYLKVDVGGLLDAEAPEGGVYIYGNSDLNVLNAIAGKDVKIETPNSMTISKIEAGVDVALDAGKNITATTVKAGNDAVLNAGNDIKIANIVEAANDLTVTADGNIHQTAQGKTSFKSGKDMTFNSANKNVGDPNTYLYVEVGEALNAEALNGGVYIAGVGDLNVDKVEAGKDVGLKAGGNLHQIAEANPEDPRIISGGNMKLEADNINVGDPENYLQVKVGGQLDANAPNGGVYIGSKDNIVIGQVAAGKDVAIESEGFIHQTDAGKRPAIIAGEDLHLLSKDDNVGDPNNYLTVQVGDKLDAAAPNGGVYIYGYGDLVTDSVIAGGDIGLGGNGDIIIPHDKEEGNIIAGGNVKIEAGDNVINAGGENVGIVAGGDIDVSANHNLKDGSVGKLPYNDLSHSINVTLKGEVKADEIGIPETDKILNIHIMGSENSGGSGDSTSTIELDDRDQRNLKYLADDNNDASVRNNRQHLRYNVNNAEYILMNSNSESGAKVKDVINISKQGMLVETDELVKVGENIKVTMDYKGLPFTVEGKVVRTDATNNTAGIVFSNVDRMTSSLILYLGMMNGR